jgi:uncharacterized surface protein with fasciclin (FAS1) repeats
MVSRLRYSGLFSVVIASSLLFQACSDDSSDPMSAQPDNQMDIVDTAIEAGSFTTLVATVQGSSLTIEAMDGTVKIDAATVVQTDIAATNGVIHVIDSVVLPQ